MSIVVVSMHLQCLHYAKLLGSYSLLKNCKVVLNLSDFLFLVVLNMVKLIFVSFFYNIATCIEHTFFSFEFILN